MKGEVEMPEIPDFKTAEEEAEFWETHSVSDYWDEFEPVKEELDPKLKAQIKARANLKRVTLRLSQEQIAAAKRIAAEKGIPYQTLIRMWIVEGIKSHGGTVV
jgi:predicted DNA binding CopG/RHH family protein